MTTTIDFGLVNDKKRLERLITKLTLEYVENDYVSLVEQEDKYWEQYDCPVNMVSINSFSDLTLNEDTDEFGETNGYTISIYHRETAIKLVSKSGFIQHEICKISEGGHIWFDILTLHSDTNLRKVEVCRACHTIKKGGKKICEECESRSCHFDAEVCSICLDKEDTDCLWVETECKHIFHKKCLQTAKGCISSVFNCPMCRERCYWFRVNEL